MKLPFELEDRIKELESKLAASEEARKTIEANAQIEIDRLNTQILDRDTKLEAAEQHIKASQEQEHTATIANINGLIAELNLGGLADLVMRTGKCVELHVGDKLYKQPPIPPELSEVVRERDELKRKLSEQRMVATDNKDWFDALKEDFDKLTTDNAELNRLLSEARKVPEGWKLVPVEPTDNGVGGMVNAGAIALKQHDDTPFMENRTGIAKSVYKAMLSASPTYKEQP